MTRSSAAARFCKICGDESDASHFGAISCRACAAFFRRRVVSRKSISIGNCKAECRIENEALRKLCGPCRYEKCLKVGMKISAVLARPVMRCNTVPCSDSLLEQMKVAYGRLENARRNIFRTGDHIPSASNYQDLNRMLPIDMGLIREHFFEFFQSKTRIIDEQQRQLLEDHFVKTYILLDGTYRCQDSNLFLMHNMDYVDLKELDRFYRNPDEEDDTNAVHVAKVLEQYWRFVSRVLKMHLREVKLDMQEFLFASALLFWDFGIPGQSDECIQVCNHMRSRIITELTDYEKSKSLSKNYPLRVGEVMVVLQSVQKVLGIIDEVRNLSIVFNMYGRECVIYS